MTQPQQTLWHRTHRVDQLPGAEALALRTALNDDEGRAPWLVADLEIYFRNGPASTAVEIKLTTAQMRELASLLHLHADRIDNELQPLRDQLAAAQAQAA